MTAPSLKIWGNSIGAFAAYGSTDGGTTMVPLKLNADGELVVNLEAATVNIGDVDVLSLPSGNLGAQAKAASLCVNPASDISDATYIGDIKFGEALPAGTNLLGKVGIDQTTPGTTDSITVKGGFKRLKTELTIPGASGAYSALDCIANASPSVTTQKIPLAGRVNAGTGSIIRAVLKTDNLSWTGQVKMVVYDGAGPAAFIADHAAFDDKYADAANIVGVIDFTGFAKTATGAAGSLMKSVVEGLNMPYECGAAVTDLYYQLFTPASSGVTPAASQKFYANIGVIRD